MAQARSPQPRDYFLDPPAKGVWAHGDLFTLGAQASIEARTPIEDETFGMASLRLSGLASLGYAETALHADVRYLFLTFGASAGIRDVWRTYTAPPGGEIPRDERDIVDNRDAFKAETWGFGEGRMRLVIPLDTFWLVSNHVVRNEGGPARAFDWFHTNVHDGGWLYKGDAVLFARSAKLGALGPLVRFMNMPRDGARENELAAGFIYAIRPGLKKRDDLLSVSVLTRPGDDEFGFHALHAPIWAFVAYRASFQLFE